MKSARLEMKRAILMVFVFCFSVNGVANSSQHNLESLHRRITIKFGHSTLGKALATLTQYFHIQFNCPTRYIQLSVQDYYAIRTEMQDVLNHILAPHDLTFTIAMQGSFEIVKSQPRSTVQGHLYDDQSGEPISYANIFFKDTHYGSTTDDQGFFLVDNIPSGIYQLMVQMIGYEQKSLRLNLSEGKSVTLSLRLSSTPIAMQEVIKTAKAEQHITQPTISSFTMDIRESAITPMYAERDVFRTMQLMPGVIMTNDYKSQLYVRGGNSDQNLVLIDGGVAYNPFHFSGVMTSFDVDAIDSVSFSTGAFQARYGGRLSSVLDVNTRKGSNTLSGIVNVTPISSKLLLEGPIGNISNYLISLRKSFMTRIGERLGNRVIPDFYDGVFRLDYRETDYKRFTVQGYFSHDQVTRKDKNQDQINSDNALINFHYRRLYDRYTFARYSIHMGRFETYLPDPARMTDDQINQMTDLSAAVYLSHNPDGPFQIETGCDLHGIKIKYRSYDPILTRYSLDHWILEGGVFVQAQKKFGKRWLSSTGIRLSYYDHQNSIQFEPRLNIRYTLYNFLFAKLAYGRFSQGLVTLYNENDTYNPVDIWLPIDASVPVSSADHYIAGLSYSTPALVITAELYYKHWNRVIRFFLTDRDILPGWSCRCNGLVNGVRFGRPIQWDLRVNGYRFNIPNLARKPFIPVMINVIRLHSTPLMNCTRH